MLVTGASGPTGRLICGALALRGATVRAMIRPTTFMSDRARVDAVRDVCPFVRYVMADLRDSASLVAAVRHVDAVVCASGTRNFEGADPNRPEIVDWRGVERLVDVFMESRLERELIAMFGEGERQMERGAAVAANAETHVQAGETAEGDASCFVLVSSLGVTRPERFPQLQQMAGLLRFKLCGEEAVRASGCPFTIVRPGGFVDTPKGEVPLVVDQGDRLAGSIARADVAEICADALFNPKATNATFECVARPGVLNGHSGGRNLFDELVKDEL